MRPGFNTGNIQELKMLWVLFIIVFHHLVIRSETKKVSKHLDPKQWQIFQLCHWINVYCTKYTRHSVPPVRLQFSKTFVLKISKMCYNWFMLNMKASGSVSLVTRKALTETTPKDLTNLNILPANSTHTLLLKRQIHKNLL